MYGGGGPERKKEKPTLAFVNRFNTQWDIILN